PRPAGTGQMVPPRPMPATGGTGPMGAPMQGGPQRTGTGSLIPGPAANPQRPGFPGSRPGGPATGGLRPGRPITGAHFLYAFGTPGFNPGEFQQPRGMTMDANKLLYVADTENSRVQVFDAQGNFQREIKPAAGRESFRFPRSVAISPTNGRIYIVDELDFRIYVFDGDGKQVSVWDRRRNASDPSAIPGRLAISPNGNIYISEPNSHRVQMYSSTHAFTAAFGANGELQSPSGLAVGPKAMLYVLDYGQCRVHQYDNKGKPGQPFGRRGAGPGEFSVPRDVAIDRSGYVFVADTLNHRIQIFSPTGDPLAVLGQKGKGEGQFAGPEGLALSQDDLLFVSDRGNGRIQVFQIDRG
ncbi:MAG: 6-bladed beta-propeller, partial [Cyanobacteria bacterium RYN_339]|nr:6-bladed beta-propeller [Cyanobacteria bacterium RYN_339]